MLWAFLRDETGATAVEYGIIIGTLSLTIVGGVSQAFDAIEWLFGDNSSKVSIAFK